VEVDLGGEDPGELRRDRIRDPRIVGGAEQGGADDPAAVGDAALQIRLVLDDPVALAVSFDARHRVGRHAVGERLEVAPVAHAGDHGLARHELAEDGLGGLVGTDEIDGVGVEYAQSVQQRRHRVAASDLIDVRVGLFGGRGWRDGADRDLGDDAFDRDRLHLGARCDAEGRQADAERQGDEGRQDGGVPADGSCRARLR
jgi:hypothetical protein